MKAIKECVNRECNSFKKRVHFKESYEYCPQCSQKIEYVCSDCWKVLEQNNDRLCVACKAKREQKRAQQISQGKELAKKAALVIPVAWKNKDKIIDAGKQVIKFVKK